MLIAFVAEGQKDAWMTETRGSNPSLESMTASGDGATRWTIGDWILIAIVVIAATLIRVNAIDAHPSADEVWQIALTAGEGSPIGRYASDRVYVDVAGETPLEQSRPLWRVWTGMGGVQHPPLYHVTLRLWRDVFGGSDAAAHAYSIAWSAVAIGFTVAAARTAMNRGAAALVGAIYAVSPVQIYFAQEIRNYSMLIGVAAIAPWVATRVEVCGATRRRAIVLAALTLPLLLLHYFAAGAVAGVAAYGLFRFRGGAWRAFVLTLASAGLVYVVAWVPFAREQFSTLYTFDAYTKVDHFDPAGEAWWTVAAPARLLVEGFWLDELRYAWPALAAGGACLVLPWILFRRNRALLPWAVVLLGTALSVALVDAIRLTWLTQLIRYLATASPAVPLLIVGIPWAIHRQAAYLTGLVAIAVLLIIPRGPLAVIADSPYFADMATWAAVHVPRGDALLVRGGEGANDRVGDHSADLQLMSLAHERSLYPRTIVKLTKPPSPELRAALPEQGWLFLPGRFALPKDPVVESLELRELLLLPRQGLIARVGLKVLTADHPK